MPILAMKAQLALHTRCENQIENEINREPVRAGDLLQSQDQQLEYRECLHRPVAPSRKYNCHGLSFASRRTWIHFAREVAKILRDDEYGPVPLDEVLPGDVAVYYKDGDAEHSGIVIRIHVDTSPFGSVKVPVVLSKWGPSHEVVHKIADCPYYAGDVIYYRIRS